MNQTPRLVAFSLWLYRLLLAAYPTAFRQEYGEAMTQLFRDTVLDGYRRRNARLIGGVVADAPGLQDQRCPPTSGRDYGPE